MQEIKINMKKIITFLGIMLFMIIIPFTVSGYKVDFLIMMMINILLAVSFHLITTTGGWSLAHVPMMGVGAYATALISGKLGVPFIFSLILSGLVAGIIGLAISFPLRRTKGLSFFVASFAAGEAIRLCWIRFKVPFGGHQGLMVPIPKIFPGIDFSKAIPYYFLILVIVLICLGVMYRIEHCRIGENFKAIHYQEDLAKSLGININSYKMLALSVGSFFAGISGVALAHRLWAIEPTQFGFSTTLYLLVWVVFGGTETFFGPILGVVILSLIGELLRPLADWVPMVYGFIIIVTLIFFPGGLESLLHGKLGRLNKKSWKIKIEIGD